MEPEVRTQETRKLVELIPEKYQNTSIVGRIKGIHTKIIQAKSEPKTELTAKDLDVLALKVCAELGIKALPSTEIIDLCLKSWEEKFQAQMNKQELALAFEMNVNGDFEPKVEHFQCFSRDYFCTILNQYLKKKQEAIARHVEPEDTSLLPPPDYHIGLMRTLIQDRKNAGAGVAITTNHTVNERLNLLAELFEVIYGEDTIQAYRIQAATEVIRELAKKKNEAIGLQKFGREIELTNQIARIKAQKLITDQDESLIQSEVTRMLYCNQLMRWTEYEFTQHIESQI